MATPNRRRDTGFAAVVLAGGRARRLGGDKPAAAVAGVPMLHRVLTAVADAAPRVVVGPPGLPVPAGAVRTREAPPGGGPVAAAAAGLALVPAGTPWAALLASDLPLLDRTAVAVLREAAAAPGIDGAVFVDDDNHPQWLCGVWRTAALAGAVSAAPPGAALRQVLGRAVVAWVPSPRHPPPWFDCDTPAQLAQAEQWARQVGSAGRRSPAAAGEEDT